MTPEERYRMAIADRHNKSGGASVYDASGPIAPGVGRDAIDSAVKKEEVKRSPAQDGVASDIGSGVGSQIASDSAQQGNMAGTIGGAAMMSGNPYLMAGGLGLTVLAAGEQNKRAQEEKERTEYNERIKNRQLLMSQIASQGIR